MNPPTATANLEEWSQRLDQIEEMVETHAEAVPSDIARAVTEGLRRVAGELDAARRHVAVSASPARSLPMRLAMPSRRRRLADRFAAIDSASEIDHLRDRARRLRSRLDESRELPRQRTSLSAS